MSCYRKSEYQKPIHIAEIDNLVVELYRTREDMGRAAGKAVAGKMRELLSQKELISMVFAAAPSQNEFLNTLVREERIDWSRVIAFHLDEYIGLPKDASQRFSMWLDEHIYNIAKPGTIYYIGEGEGSPEEKCLRYSELLKDCHLDIACIGIGENGHIAFNDPPVADFNDPYLVKIVELDETCRMQQVHDGCFPSLSDVPTQAATMTIPAIMSAAWMYCIVPGSSKGQAVKDTVEGEISTKCPASILRTHDHARLFLDPDSAAGLSFFAKKSR
ncbi:MAG: glucosamine-6-phosphate deaminase [Firmicutes bacterium]|nr:glucosamine-6-phosphate deaminase [Bacillota bacterium]HXL04143.1 glucosamine-6-phosphate deaminase [Bacillota bacterium]